MTSSGMHRSVEIVVTSMFRGERQDHVTILTGLGTGDCGLNFQTGETYLVFAVRGDDGSWFTSICQGTSKTEDSSAALRFLKNEAPTSDDLLSPQEYSKHYIESVLPSRTGSVCGVVLKPDGTPLKGARVDLSEVRNDELPLRSASDPNTSSESGHFCIEHVEPASYLLTVEDEDYDHDARYMAYYPGVSSRVQAAALNIQASVRLPDVKLTTFYESLFLIRIHVVRPDGTPLSYKEGCGVMVDSVDRDSLSYHINHALEEDGTYTFGYIPAGKYQVRTYFQPDYRENPPKPFAEAAKWKPAVRDVTVSANTEVVIRLEPTEAR
jgi:hypothetical protein